MRPTKVRRFAVVAVVLLAGAAVLVATTLPQRDKDDELTPAEAAGFADFPLYWVGETFEDLELAYISYDMTTGAHEEPGQNVVDIGYGTCDPPPFEGGCALPLSIQIWPSCQRNPSMYSLGSHSPEELTIHGAPALMFDTGGDAGRLEVYTGSVAIVIWTYDNEQTIRAAHALHRVGANPDMASESLPKPVPGALDGTGRCPPTLESGEN